MTKSTTECVFDECSDVPTRRGYCTHHYNTYYRRNRADPLPQKACLGCKELFTPPRKEAMSCSKECRSIVLKERGAAMRDARAITQAQYAETVTKRDYRGPLMRAYEDGDKQAVIARLKAHTAPMQTVEGMTPCWEWQKSLNETAYGMTSIAQKNIYVHRLMSWACHDDYREELVVHHVCANRRCCNPGHLQPVTQKHNLAEMVERNYYIRRIAALEAALADVAPTHPELMGGRIAA